MDKQAASVSLGITCFCFMGGIVAGSLAGMRGGASADLSLTRFLEGFIAGETASPSYFQAFFNAFFYPLLSFLLGLSLLGVFFLPFVVSARGFLLSFTVTACVRVFGGGGGFLLSSALLGLPSLLTVPCLFLLASRGGVSSFGMLRTAMRKGTAAPVSIECRQLGICLAAMTAAALAEIYLGPVLLRACLPLLR